MNTVCTTGTCTTADCCEQQGKGRAVAQGQQQALQIAAVQDSQPRVRAQERGAKIVL